MELNILDVCKDYNIGLDKKNKALCPFHKEKTPSFTITPEKNLFYCFGCGTGGDAIRLKALLTNQSDIDIIKSLGPPSYREMLNLIRRCDERKREEAQKQIESNIWAGMCSLYKKLQKTVNDKSPGNMDGVWNDEWCNAVNELFYCELWFDSEERGSVKIERRRIYKRGISLR